MNNQLILENVTVHRDKTLAVNDITFALSPGEIACILGPSASGKSTILRAIAGFNRVSSGYIQIKDQKISTKQFCLPPEKRGVGMVFQDFALFPHLNVRDNIEFGLHHLASKKRTERIGEMLDLVDLREVLYNYPHELSIGQQQRVALALQRGDRAVDGLERRRRRLPDQGHPHWHCLHGQLGPLCDRFRKRWWNSVPYRSLRVALARWQHVVVREPHQHRRFSWSKHAQRPHVAVRERQRGGRDRDGWVDEARDRVSALPSVFLQPVRPDRHVHPRASKRLPRSHQRQRLFASKRVA